MSEPIASDGVHSISQHHACRARGANSAAQDCVGVALETGTTSEAAQEQRTGQLESSHRAELQDSRMHQAKQHTAVDGHTRMVKRSINFDTGATVTTAGSKPLHQQLSISQSARGQCSCRRQRRVT